MKHSHVVSIPVLFKRLLISVLIIPIFMSGCSTDTNNAGVCFQETFQKAPDGAVSELVGYADGYRDWDSYYLRFRIALPNCKKLIGSTFFKITQKTFTDGVQGPIPKWWKPAYNPGTLYMESSKFHPGHSTGDAYLCYDPSTQIVYFCWTGLD